MPTKIGIYGGSFDPIHNAHLMIAETACEFLKLDRLLFIPAHVSPHKTGRTSTPAEHRYNMVKLAVKDNRCFDVSRIEIDRKGKSFTVDTLEQIQAHYGVRPDNLYMIIGGDSYVDLRTWREPEKIVKLCKIVVAARPGFERTNGLFPPPENVIFLPTPLLDISSSAIRNKLKKGQKVDEIPPAVYQYIRENSLYFN